MKKNRDFYFFLAILLVNGFFISLAIYFYPEKFLLSYPLSYAGMASSFTLGLANPISKLLYASGMFLSSLIMAWLAAYRWRNKKRYLLPTIAEIGFLIAAS